MGLLRRTRELALFALLVTVVVTVARVVSATFDDTSGGGPSVVHGAAPITSAPRPAADRVTAVRWNGIPAQRWLLPVPDGTPVEGLERLLERSAAWRAPLFPEADTSDLVLPFGSLDEGAIGTWEVYGDRARCRVALLVRAGSNGAHLVFLRTTGDVLTIDGDDMRMLSVVERPRDIELPEDVEPVYSVGSEDGDELALWFRTPDRPDSATSVRASLTDSGWTEYLVAGPLHSYHRGARRCDLILDTESVADSLAQLRVYTDPAGPLSGSRNEG